ncbi:MAG TPA: LD-carboxypeptidase [Candidatus Cybelea sp.]|nr:LD-carboxypeptidase [Candidatus Cybelea sp.]
MPEPVKPPGLRRGDVIRVLSLASPVDESRLEQGCQELERLGYAVAADRTSVLAQEGFFAGSPQSRRAALRSALGERTSRAIFCSRGGYGSTYLLDDLGHIPPEPKILCGFSDITSLHIFLWKTARWATLYGPMVASGLAGGADALGGYDTLSLQHALTETGRPWSVDLCGESLSPGEAEGVLVGGCLTLVETTLGTPWEPDTSGAILILEDRDMKPYQVDRALMHLKQAGKFHRAAGVILGEFPGGDAQPGAETVRDVARRILGALGLPLVWGAAIGHTSRPMLTLPLGVRARLSTIEGTALEILEPAVA